MSVHVIGNITLDRTLTVDRLPRAGETLLASDKTTDLGGKGFNQAVTAARAGARTVLWAPVGADDDGATARRLSAVQERLTCRFWARGGATDESFILRRHDGENVIVSTAVCAGSVTPAEAAAAIRSALAGDVCVMQGNLPADTTAAALGAARSRGLWTLLNPAPLQFDVWPLLPAVDVLVVNEPEAAGTGPGPLAERIGRLAAAARRAAIVTLGAAGALIADGSGRREIAAPSVRAVDTVGAGDAFCGTLAAALARHVDLDSAVRWACAVAAETVKRPGTLAAFPPEPVVAALGANLGIAPPDRRPRA
jgi:ribokinase